jgi:hypothetical protein
MLTHPIQNSQLIIEDSDKTEETALKTDRGREGITARLVAVRLPA